MNDKVVKLTIEMEVTGPQALALKAMFEYWNELSSIGSSREVAFYVDGDGNFHPKCKITSEPKIVKLTDDMRAKAIVADDNGDRVYDFDPIASMEM